MKKLCKLCFFCQGYRVIAAAMKILGISYVKAQRASRDQLEKDLHLLGLIVLENRLKPQTTPVVSLQFEIMQIKTFCKVPGHVKIQNILKKAKIMFFK